MTRTNLYSLFIVVVFTLSGTAQTGGTFDLSHAVIASGGGTSSGSAGGGPTFTVDGTAGQNIAGTLSASPSPQFSLRGGFWAFQAAGPTAAAVSIRGRISTTDGNSVFRARITLTGSSGITRTAIANQFGYYRLDGVDVGQTYIVSVTAKRLQFISRAIFVTDELTDLNFVAM